MINYFIGKNQSYLETALSQAQDDLANGRTVTSAGAGDAKTEEVVEVDVWMRLEQLLYALAQLDLAGGVQPPGKYPMSQCRRVTRTKIQVYPWNYPIVNA